MTDDMDYRFDYRAPDAERVRKHEHCRGILKTAARDLTAITLPGREQSLALTKLEEALFWANAAIARNS